MRERLQVVSLVSLAKAVIEYCEAEEEINKSQTPFEYEKATENLNEKHSTMLIRAQLVMDRYNMK